MFDPKSPLNLILGISVLVLLLVVIGWQVYKMNNKVTSPNQDQTSSNATPNTDTTKSPVASSSTTGLANPASVNCTKKGGSLTIKKNGAGAEYGVCNFEDGQTCEEWALFRGECPVGGIRTTGFDTPAQIYCAILGGKTLAVKDAKCTLPSGKVCSDEDLWNGKCS